MRMLGNYLSLGLKYGAAALFAALLAVVLLYFLRGDRGSFRDYLRARKTVWRGMLVLYFAFLFCAAFWDRGQFDSTWYSISLFASYREAVISGDPIQWLNIVLNILLFVPLGLLFASRSCPWREWRQAIPAGFAVSVLVELLQYLTKTGIADIDDVLNNGTGFLVGYFFWLFMLSKRDGLPTRRRLPYIVPMLAPALLLAAFLIPNVAQPFGYFDFDRALPVSVTKARVDIADSALSDIPKDGTLPVYRLEVLNESGARALAEQIFSAQGTHIADDRTLKYDTCVFFYAEKYNATLNYNYRDGSFQLVRTVDDGVASPFDGVAEKNVRALLRQKGFFVPDVAIAERQQDGGYKLEAAMAQENGGIYDGSIVCRWNADARSELVDYQIHALRFDRDCAAVPVSEVCERLESGDFSCAGGVRDYGQTYVVTDLQCRSAAIRYEADTKGFYRPVYEIDANINGAEQTIFMSAVQF